MITFSSIQEMLTVANPSFCTTDFTLESVLAEKPNRVNPTAQFAEDSNTSPQGSLHIYHLILTLKSNRNCK
jgi:hypothetical protein